MLHQQIFWLNKTGSERYIFFFYRNSLDERKLILIIAAQGVLNKGKYLAPCFRSTKLALMQSGREK